MAHEQSVTAAPTASRLAVLLRALGHIRGVQTLRLPVSSDPADRAQAYRKRVLETHPDKAPVKTAANADAFAELQAAYALIRDEDVRRQFDLQMRIGRYGPVNAAAATRCGRDAPVEDVTD